MQGQGQGQGLQLTTHKLTHKDQDKHKDKDFTYSYLLQVAAKPTIAIKQQQMNTKWKFTTYDCKIHYSK